MWFVLNLKNKTKIVDFLFGPILENDCIFTLLLRNGANIEHETIIGSTPLDLATYAGCFDDILKFYFLICKTKTMLESCRQFYIISGNEKFLKILIEAGANVNHTAIFEDQPLHISSQYGEIKNSNVFKLIDSRQTKA